MEIERELCSWSHKPLMYSSSRTFFFHFDNHSLSEPGLGPVRNEKVRVLPEDLHKYKILINVSYVVRQPNAFFQ
jgi:hypothetical protein